MVVCKLVEFKRVQNLSSGNGLNLCHTIPVLMTLIDKLSRYIVKPAFSPFFTMFSSLSKLDTITFSYIDFVFCLGFQFG